MQKETNGVPADSAKATGTTAGVASTGIAAGMTTSSGTAKTAGKAAAVATTGAATGPAATGVAPDPMPDEEMLYDLADLFKVFGDTTRIKILYALMGTRASAWQTSPTSSAPRKAPCRTSCARSSRRAW